MKVLFWLVFIVLVLWDPLWAAAGVRQMGPRALLRRLAAPGPPLVFDVRTEAEYRWFRIPGAIRLSAGSPTLLKDALEIAERSGGRDVVVVCMTGHRSPLVAKRLAERGVDAANLTWGMLGWKLTGGDTVSG
ncbi:MAG: rhodanese-like domain-containing protein [Desulfovibrionaceae bacterium]